MKKYESLTKYLPMMQQDTFGEWHIDQKNDGTMEHPYEMPYIEYSKQVKNFEKDVYAFAEDHPDYDLNKYGEILERNGIKWGSKSMQAAKTDEFDAQTILALIMGAVRAERFCDGALLGFFERGDLGKWLERLQNLDEENSG
jgi:hypothetical protein